jgi:hypothetical protein
MRYLGLEDAERERATRTGSQMFIAFVDIDDLKTVNDSKGHRAGDDLLRLVGETLRKPSSLRRDNPLRRRRVPLRHAQHRRSRRTRTLRHGQPFPLRRRTRQLDQLRPRTGPIPRNTRSTHRARRHRPAPNTRLARRPHVAGRPRLQPGCSIRGSAAPRSCTSCRCCRWPQSMLSSQTPFWAIPNPDSAITVRRRTCAYPDRRSRP